MRCPRCETENPEQARFCMNCAAALFLICRECGTELPPAAKFCFRCAAPVVPPAPTDVRKPDSAAQRLQRLVPKEYAERLLATRGQVQAERRTVTILFSDVKGSTSMAERLDPEDWAEIMDGAFDVLIEPICRYEGTLARLMGDAILAFFGAPIAHEDDPERACRAALDIIQGAREYAVKLEEERGISDFNVRVGINTGLVVIGEVGSDLHVEYTAMGDAVNLAQRMESAAEPGTVLITAATHKLIAPLFETEDLGRIQVKGRKQLVSTYRVLAPKGVARKVRGMAGLESPMVGREAEFAALREALARLQAGVGGIVTITGEAGIGKSRLVAEVRKALLSPSCHPEGTEGSRLDRGEILRPFGAQNDKPLPLQWVEGRCLSYGTSIAYLPWLAVLRALLGVGADDPPSAVGEALRARVKALRPEQFDSVYPYLARLLSIPLEVEYQTALRVLAGERLRSRIFDAVETCMECAAREGPVVLLCEDWHWADPTSVALLEHLLSLTDRVALLFICVFRADVEHPSWQVRESAARMYPHRHTDLWLRPLSAADCQAMVENLLELEDLPAALRQRVLRYAEGNPLYVEEIIRSLIDHGSIMHDDVSGRWQVIGNMAEIPLAETLEGALVARIDRLQEDTKRVLQMASVIGRVFLLRVLACVASEEAHLDEHMLALQRAQMISERARIPEPEYVFKHELTREAAYHALLKKDRRTFHRRAAQALEELFPDRIEEYLGLLAHHWQSAGDAEKAVEYLLRAGDQALSIFALGEAIGFFRQAEQMAREQGWTLQLGHALEGVANAHQAMGENEQALANFTAALQLSQVDLKRADLYNKIGYIHYMHMDDRTQALACYENAIAAVGDATDSVEMARISLNLGYAYLLGPGADRDRTLHHLRQAQRILEGSEQWRELALCYAYLAFMIRMESPEDGIEYGQRALAICDRFGLSATAEPAFMALGHAHRMMGHWEEATSFYEAALDVNRTTTGVMGRAIACYFVALAYLAAGRIGEAIQLGKQSLGASQKIGLDLYIWRAEAILAAAYTLANRPEAAADCAQEASAISGNGIRFQYALCCIYAQLGHQEEAPAILRGIASQLDNGLRAWALRDPDLAGLREQAEFGRLTAVPSVAENRPGEVAG